MPDVSINPVGQRADTYSREVSIGNARIGTYKGDFVFTDDSGVIIQGDANAYIRNLAPGSRAYYSAQASGSSSYEIQKATEAQQEAEVAARNKAYDAASKGDSRALEQVGVTQERYSQVMATAPEYDATKPGSPYKEDTGAPVGPQKAMFTAGVGPVASGITSQAVSKYNEAREKISEGYKGRPDLGRDEEGKYIPYTPYRQVSYSEGLRMGGGAPSASIQTAISEPDVSKSEYISFRSRMLGGVDLGIVAPSNLTGGLKTQYAQFEKDYEKYISGKKSSKAATEKTTSETFQLGLPATKINKITGKETLLEEIETPVANEEFGPAALGAVGARLIYGATATTESAEAAAKRVGIKEISTPVTIIEYNDGKSTVTTELEKSSIIPQKGFTNRDALESIESAAKNAYVKYPKVEGGAPKIEIDLPSPIYTRQTAQGPAIYSKEQLEPQQIGPFTLPRSGSAEYIGEQNRKITESLQKGFSETFANVPEELFPAQRVGKSVAAGLISTGIETIGGIKSYGETLENTRRQFEDIKSPIQSSDLTGKRGVLARAEEAKGSVVASTVPAASLLAGAAAFAVLEGGYVFSKVIAPFAKGGVFGPSVGSIVKEVAVVGMSASAFPSASKQYTKKGEAYFDPVAGLGGSLGSYVSMKGLTSGKTVEIIKPGKTKVTGSTLVDIQQSGKIQTAPARVEPSDIVKGEYQIVQAEPGGAYSGGPAYTRLKATTPQKLFGVIELEPKVAYKSSVIDISQASRAADLKTTEILGRPMKTQAEVYSTGKTGNIAFALPEEQFSLALTSKGKGVYGGELEYGSGVLTKETSITKTLQESLPYRTPPIELETTINPRTVAVARDTYVGGEPTPYLKGQYEALPSYLKNEDLLGMKRSAYRLEATKILPEQKKIEYSLVSKYETPTARVLVSKDISTPEGTGQFSQYLAKIPYEGHGKELLGRLIEKEGYTKLESNLFTIEGEKAFSKVSAQHGFTKSYKPGGSGTHGVYFEKKIGGVGGGERWIEPVSPTPIKSTIATFGKTEEIYTIGKVSPSIKEAPLIETKVIPLERPMKQYKIEGLDLEDLGLGFEYEGSTAAKTIAPGKQADLKYGAYVGGGAPRDFGGFAIKVGSEDFGAFKDMKKIVTESKDQGAYYNVDYISLQDEKIASGAMKIKDLSAGAGKVLYKAESPGVDIEVMVKNVPESSGATTPITEAEAFPKPVLRLNEFNAKVLGAIEPTEAQSLVEFTRGGKKPPAKRIGYDEKFIGPIKPIELETPKGPPQNLGLELPPFYGMEESISSTFKEPKTVQLTQTKSAEAMQVEGAKSIAATMAAQTSQQAKVFGASIASSQKPVTYTLPKVFVSTLGGYRSEAEKPALKVSAGYKSTPMIEQIDYTSQIPQQKPSQIPISYQPQKSYQSVSPTQIPKGFQMLKESQFSKQIQSPKEIQMLREFQLPRDMQIPKDAQTPKDTQIQKDIQVQKQTQPQPTPPHPSTPPYTPPTPPPPPIIGGGGGKIPGGFFQYPTSGKSSFGQSIKQKGKYNPSMVSQLFNIQARGKAPKELYKEFTIRPIYTGGKTPKTTQSKQKFAFQPFKMKGIGKPKKS